MKPITKQFPMKLKSLAAAFLAAVLWMGLAGCESVALIGRPDVSSPGVSTGRIVGEVERLDVRRGELYVRTADNRTQVVVYHPDTRVRFHDRSIAVSELRSGDLVSIEIERDSAGRLYAESIHLDQGASERDRYSSRREGNFDTIAGTVERIDLDRASFEILPPRGGPVAVFVDARRDMTFDRFRSLHTGDYVRAEGRFIGTSRFSMDSFISVDSRLGSR